MLVKKNEKYKKALTNQNGIILFYLILFLLMFIFIIEEN